MTTVQSSRRWLREADPTASQGARESLEFVELVELELTTGERPGALGSDTRHRIRDTGPQRRPKSWDAGRSWRTAMSDARRIIVTAAASASEALAAYDSLEGVTVEFMLGWWRGVGIRTGHPLDGVLEAYGWWGKEFVSATEVYPLLFRLPGAALHVPSEGGATADGSEASPGAASERLERSGLVSLDPRFLPVRIGMTLPLRRTRAAAMAFRVVSRLIRTSESRAVLDVTEHRGARTVAMTYLDQPVTDYFRRVDDETVLAVMELKGDARRYFFALIRA